jgi:hypothetical protein
MLMTGSASIDAERAFARARRRRRRAALAGWLRRVPAECRRLEVYDGRRPATSRSRAWRGVREIPIEAINATLDPGKASLFDAGFRPSPAARTRWERVWMAEQRGAVLPPISVIPLGDAYAVTDGHHRVSVARARGAYTIDAAIELA